MKNIMEEASVAMFDRHYGAWPDGAPKSLFYPQTGLFDALAVSGRRFADKPALHYYGNDVSYGALLSSTERLAGYLAGPCRVAKSDRVLLMMQNAPQFLIAYYAILRADAVVVPVNPMLRAAEVAHILKDTGARTVICGQECLPAIRACADKKFLDRAIVAAYADYAGTPEGYALPEVVAAPRTLLEGRALVAWSDALEADEELPPSTAGPDDWAVMPYSSGTTDAPKGCLHTHRSVMATLFGSVAWYPSSPASVYLTTLPLFHVTGMQNSMNVPVFTGATMVLMTRWDRHTALKLIARHRVTHWRAITTMAIDVLSDPAAATTDLSSLVTIGGGGAQMPAAVAGKLKRLTGLDYLEGYGLTETMAATHINPPERPKRQCLGIPIFDVDARVIDPETLIEREPGEVGEIIMHGPQLFEGYWQRPRDTEAAFVERDGKRFFRSGDLGYYDEEGYFFLVDRLKRMINASGFKVWPSELEAVLHHHPAIREACVIAAPDPHRGETVKAVVVRARGASLNEADLIAWCRERMAGYKVPRLVEFVDSLPRSGAGKVQWRTLQERERKRVPAGAA